MNPPTRGNDMTEIPLTPEQLQETSKTSVLPVALDDAQTSSVFSSMQPLLRFNSPSRFRRGRWARIVKMVGVVLAYVALAWWSASKLAVQPHTPGATSRRPIIVSHRPGLPANPLKPVASL